MGNQQYDIALDLIDLGIDEVTITTGGVVVDRSLNREEINDIHTTILLPRGWAGWYLANQARFFRFTRDW